MRLAGKVALVTGAGQGIGEATARAMAREGAAVALLDWRVEKAEEVALSITDAGGRALPLEADVRDQAQVEAAFDKARQRFSRLDILVNNAGYDRPGALGTITNEKFDQVLDVHLKGCLNCSRLAAEIMKDQRRGGIVNVSSIYGKSGAKGELAYSAAKAALIGLSKSMARELGPYNVRVNVVLPGLTDTPTILNFMKQEYKQAIIRETPLGRSARPEEVASVIAFLASDEASFVTGACVEVSGGWGM